jgi:serine/threonine protein kinase
MSSSDSETRSGSGEPIKGEAHAYSAESDSPSEKRQPLQSVRDQLCRLQIVSAEAWDAALEAIGPRTDLEAVLSELTRHGQHHDGMVLARLTAFQKEQTLAGCADGLRLDHYVLLDRIGRGATGEVYTAHNLTNDRIEAIKIMRASVLQASRGARRRFQKEADALKELRHPGLPRLHHFGWKSGMPYIAMEYVPGRTLDRVLDEKRHVSGCVTVREATEWVYSVAEVLAFAHERGYVHRDIKPSNVAIAPAGELKLLDLGLARLFRFALESVEDGDSPTPVTTSGAILGTPAYMPPEQWRDASKATVASDIYSLGCLYHFVLTGSPPFGDARSAAEYRRAHESDRAQAVSRNRSDVPDRVDQIIARMLAKEPRERYPTATHLMDDLRPLLDDSQRPSDANLLNVSLVHWPLRFQIATAIVGDRRESPPHTSADLLALPAATGDLFYFSNLGLHARIRSDKIVKIAAEDRLRDKLDHDLLIIGSPAVNLAARIVNDSACFRFCVSSQTRELEARFDRDLKPITFLRRKLREYIEDESEDGRQRLRELNHMRIGFARAGFIDPVNYNGLRGFAKRAYEDYGIVTICQHPWSRDRIAILAGGIGGPGTAGALKQLATPGAFSQHPLGGVFRVLIPTEGPWEDRFDDLDVIWDTPDYTVADYQRDARYLTQRVENGTVPRGEGLTSKDLDSLMALIETLRRRFEPPIQADA